MLKDWKHIDLSKATIFDLTDDIALIRESLGDNDFTKEDTSVYLQNVPRYFHILALYSYAEITDNEFLYQAIKDANPDVPPAISDVMRVSKFERP